MDVPANFITRAAFYHHCDVSAIWRGAVKLPLNALRYYSFTSIIKTVKHSAALTQISPRRNLCKSCQRVSSVARMVDKSTVGAEEQHATRPALKLVNRLGESRSPYVCPHLCAAKMSGQTLTRTRFEAT